MARGAMGQSMTRKATPIAEGQTVRYWKGLRRGVYSGTAKVISIGDLSGTPVAWLEGVSGCIACTHLQPVPEIAS